MVKEFNCRDMSTGMLGVILYKRDQYYYIKFEDDSRSLVHDSDVKVFDKELQKKCN